MGRFALKRIKRTQVRKGMVLVARTETPPKGTSLLVFQKQGHWLTNSGKEVRVYGHGPPPLFDDTAEIPSNDALWCYPRMSLHIVHEMELTS
jgi:hypothetical protein